MQFLIVILSATVVVVGYGTVVARLIRRKVGRR
jgi:hypothetical protein